jgi:hypothetical protein
MSKPKKAKPLKKLTKKELKQQSEVWKEKAWSEQIARGECDIPDELFDQLHTDEWDDLGDWGQWKNSTDRKQTKSW